MFPLTPGTRQGKHGKHERVWSISIYASGSLGFLTSVSIASLCKQLTLKDLQPLFFFWSSSTHMPILWDWRVIIIQRLKSGLIHRGVSRADQRDLGEDRTRNVERQRRQSLREHLDVLRGELDQSFRNKDGLRRWSDLSCIPPLSFTLLLEVSIYLPELPGTAPCFRLSCVYAAG